MRFEVKRCFLLSFLVLTTMFLACSLVVTGEKMERLVHTSDAEEFFGAVALKQRKGRPLLLANLMASVVPQRPPPSPRAPNGPGQHH